MSGCVNLIGGVGEGKWKGGAKGKWEKVKKVNDLLDSSATLNANSTSSGSTGKCKPSNLGITCVASKLVCVLSSCFWEKRNIASISNWCIWKIWHKKKSDSGSADLCESANFLVERGF